MNITSHNYPYYYPDDAYVLWTFQYESGAESTGIIYRLTFGYVYLGYNDYLHVGTGWDPNNTISIIASLYGYYSGYPTDVSIPAGKMFVEFDADSYSETSGFRIIIGTWNISGTS